MNIFLDSSIIYKDPFWKGNFYKKLLEFSDGDEIRMYMSSVVRMEIERNYEKIIDEAISVAKKIHVDMAHYNISNSQSLILDKEKSMTELKSFYDNLVALDTIKILDYSNIQMFELVDRSIQKRKPFSDNKTELKDAIIWLTYSKHAELEKLEDCILFSENIKDFCDLEKAKNEEFVIHPDLVQDCDKFKFFKTSKSLFEHVKPKLEASTKFATWLKTQKIDEEFAFSVARDYQQEIFRRIENELDNYTIPEIFLVQNVNGHVDLAECSFNRVHAITSVPFEQECLIYGSLLAFCSVDGWEDRHKYKNGVQDWDYFGRMGVCFEVSFSFYYDRTKQSRDFNIEDVEMIDPIVKA